jgi:CheY-like chemotaxis protein
MPHEFGDNLAIESALVCDDDETARTLVLNYLKELGVENVDSFENGELAWEAIQKRQYSLLVLDWKLPGLSGLALFNRIRQKKTYRDTPVLVVSGFVDRNDFRLLQEMPFTSLMEKPFTKTLFFNKLEAVFREADWYLQNAAMIDSLMSAVEHDAKKSESLLKEVLRKAPNPIPLGIVAARALTKHKMLKEAEHVLRGLLERDDASVIAMNELGKVLLRGGDHRGALDVLRAAHKVSPQNMQRICLLGEAELNLKNPEEAHAYFEKALEIDGDDKKAQAGLIVADNLARAEGIDDAKLTRQVSTSLASILNTIGIALVRSGQYDRGVEQYRAALAFLHQREDAARVAFNLGLGLLRWGKTSEALPWFQKSERLSPDGFAKSTRYVKRLLMSGSLGKAVEQELGGDVVGAAEAPAPATTAAPPAAAKDNVIPFPTKPAEEPASDGLDEQLEEHVGSEASVGKSSGKSDEGDSIDTDDLELEDAPDTLVAV